MQLCGYESTLSHIITYAEWNMHVNTAQNGIVWHSYRTCELTCDFSVISCCRQITMTSQTWCFNRGNSPKWLELCEAQLLRDSYVGPRAQVGAPKKSCEAGHVALFGADRKCLQLKLYQVYQVYQLNSWSSDIVCEKLARLATFGADFFHNSDQKVTMMFHDMFHQVADGAGHPGQQITPEAWMKLAALQRMLAGGLLTQARIQRHRRHEM